MTDESAQILDDLLSRWHGWMQGEKTGRGHAERSLVCGDYRVSRQYDDSNGALDDELHAMRSRQVNVEVRRMEEPHRSAIYVNARNLHTGRDVWVSPRLPESKVERLAVITVARGMLVRLLVSSGVM